MESLRSQPSSVVIWLCIASIVAVLVIYGNSDDDPPVNKSSSVSENESSSPISILVSISIPMVQLRSKVITTTDHLPISSSTSSRNNESIPHLLPSKTPPSEVLKPKRRRYRSELEEGLARARASIRSAAAANSGSGDDPNRSSTALNDAVLSGAVYRNPRALY